MMNMERMVVACMLLCMVNLSLGDLYMHNPRGSNDRLNENGVNRNNGNRLFDSQNNAKGGYCWGPKMTYYVGSILSVEWTNQHSCNNPNSDCNFVIQYMCGDEVRDGLTTNTIPDDENEYNEVEDTADLEEQLKRGYTAYPYLYGMHEDYWYYQNCKDRQRNLGLFVADREDPNVGNLQGQDARFTRQNNNGNRQGFECNEERDYYPYWHPTPWRDIAVLVTHEDRCDFYKSESQNVKDKGNCTDPQYNNADACESKGAKWKSQGSWGISAPDCKKAEWTRDNHLGNSILTGRTNHYNWTIPDHTHENCVLRMRYNLTTEDYDAWVGGTTSRSNGEKSPVTQDPYVLVSGKNLSMALNTNQYGRTFQDRSHVFKIASRPSHIKDDARIFNLNVRGKRGNIVEAYPAVEYDFVPEQLYVRKDDYIHFQWTGCDTNPNNYAGEGTRGTDRNNMVELSGMAENYPGGKSGNSAMFPSGSQRSSMAHLDQEEESEFYSKFIGNNLLGDYMNENIAEYDYKAKLASLYAPCLDQAALLAKNNNNQNTADEDQQNCMKINRAPTPYHDGGTLKMRKVGSYSYMSTRNNNYTNRSQKGVVVVVPLLPLWAIVLLALGGTFFMGSGGLTAASIYAKQNPTSGVANVLSKF